MLTQIIGQVSLFNYEHYLNASGSQRRTTVNQVINFTYARGMEKKKLLHVPSVTISFFKQRLYK